MWNDEAVGGFFEDLPVLAFILTGSLLIVSTNVAVTDQRDELERSERIELAAGRLAGSILAAISDGCGEDNPLDSLRALNLSTLLPTPELPQASGWAIFIAMVHPWHEPLANCSRGSPDSSAEAGWHCLLFNVSYGQYGVGVAEVVAVVFE